jgi:hypothetical protein
LLLRCLKRMLIALLRFLKFAIPLRFVRHLAAVSMDSGSNPIQIDTADSYFGIRATQLHDWLSR